MENEFEADVFAALLDEERIPHTLINHHSMAYNGLFQMTMGWGHFEIPESYLEKADELLRAMRASQPE